MIFLHLDDPNDAARIPAFIDSVNPAKIAGLKIAKLGKEQGADVKKLSTENGEAFRSPERTERLVLYSLNGKHFIGGFTLLRYKDGWKLSEMVSNLGGTSAYGAVAPTSSEDIDSVVRSFAILRIGALLASRGLRRLQMQSLNN